MAVGHNPEHHPQVITDDKGVILSENSQRYKDTVRVTLVGSVFDFLLGVAKIAVGFVSHSQALIADGVHSLSDLATDVAVIYAAKHSHREADEEHPYGHGRIETVATVGLGLALVAVAVGIAIDAARRLFHPDLLLIPGVWALIIALLSVVIKEAIYQYTMIYARKYRSKMLRANAWHSRSDAISSIVVVIGVLGSMAGLQYLDAIAAIGVALMIAKIGWDLGWHSIQELIDRGLEAERVAAIRELILSVDGVKTLHILRTRHMGADALVDVHIQVEPRISVSEGHYISETVRQKLINEIDEVADVMVHIDPEDDEHLEYRKKLPLRHELLNKLNQAWSGLEEAAQLRNINLHYLEGKIEIELLLPLTILHNAGPETATALQQKFTAALSSAGVTEVHKLSLNFQ